MARSLQVINEADVAPADRYGHPMGEATGVRSARTLTPDDYSLRLVVAQLDDGATLSWPPAHGDEALYVRSGALAVDPDVTRMSPGDAEAAVVPADGAVIVEADAPCTVRAVGPTEVADFAPVDPATRPPGPRGVAAAGGHGVHVFPPEACYLSEVEDRFVVRWYLDGTCPTCRLQLFHVRRHPPDGVERGPTHHHSEDEVIFVTDGSVRTGAFDHGPGTALSIPGDMRYAVTAAEGYGFLNYRADLATMVREPGSAPILEVAGALEGSSPD